MQKKSGPEKSKNHDVRVDSSESVGAFLRDRRMRLDIALEKVSEATGISAAVLQALENDEREKLPADVYVKAFYKKYAEYLGLDPEEAGIEMQQPAQALKKARRSSGFRTVFTIKGQEENLLADVLRGLFLLISILLIGVLFYWIYKNHLASFNPLGVYQKHFPSLCSFPPAIGVNFFC